jgi:hypothetical protein
MPMTLPMHSKIFTIFEGTSEIQRMLIGRTVTRRTFGSLTCGYTYHVPGKRPARLESGMVPSRVRIIRNVPVISRCFRTAC